MTDPSKKVDNLGKRCTRCGLGCLVETSVMDDIQGVLHCSNCKLTVSRYRGTSKDWWEK